MAECPEMVKILEARRETPVHRTLVLDKRLEDARPGQFCMLWLPGVGEKPMSFSRTKGNAAVTVHNVGSFTRRLSGLRRGDCVGFRGPYGNGFTVVKGSVMVVGGGCGVAPLIPLVQQLSRKGSRVLVLAGSKTRAECLIRKGAFFRKEVGKLGGVEVATTTDFTASEGKLVTVPVELHLEKAKNSGKKFGMVYCCGPEPMMKKVMDLCRRYKTPCQLSLERYMKCGIGLCGSCMLSTYRVCRDGPVFTGKQLEGTEFGKYSRTAEGRRLHFRG